MNTVLNFKVGFAALFLSIVISSCHGGGGTVSGGGAVPKGDPSLNAVLYQQSSAEYAGLCYQAYNLAYSRLKRMAESGSGDTSRAVSGEYKFAIVSDLDETVLDNSPYNAQLILDGEFYTPATWKQWVDKAEADLVPGAKRFFTQAEKLGIEIFYISNRRAENLDATILNLKKHGLPFADSTHVLLLTDDSDKAERYRQLRKAGNTIRMKLGDNMNDFDTDITQKTGDSRKQFMDILSKGMGTDFIIFPNPMYGNWEGSGLYDGKRGLTPHQKDSIKLTKLKGWR